MKRVPVYNKDGVVGCALVDDGDYDRVAQHRWSIERSGYARRMAGPSGRRRQLAMHRIIMGVTDPKVHVDHRNRNRLDNRRSNLRVGSHALNQQNRVAHKKGNETSRFRGVCWHKHASKWVAQIGLDRKRIYLGLFEDELEAAEVVDAKRAEIMPWSEPDPELLAVQSKRQKEMVGK